MYESWRMPDYDLEEVVAQLRLVGIRRTSENLYVPKEGVDPNDDRKVALYRLERDSGDLILLDLGPSRSGDRPRFLLEPDLVEERINRVESMRLAFDWPVVTHFRTAPDRWTTAVKGRLFALQLALRPVLDSMSPATTRDVSRFGREAGEMLAKLHAPTLTHAQSLDVSPGSWPYRRVEARTPEGVCADAKTAGVPEPMCRRIERLSTFVAAAVVAQKPVYAKGLVAYTHGHPHFANIGRDPQDGALKVFDLDLMTVGSPIKDLKVLIEAARKYFDPKGTTGLEQPFANEAKEGYLSTLTRRRPDFAREVVLMFAEEALDLDRFLRELVQNPSRLDLERMKHIVDACEVTERQFVLRMGGMRAGGMVKHAL